MKLDNVREILLSDDGEHLYSVSLNDDKIVRWSVDIATGGLTLGQELTNGSDGISNMDGPLNMVMSHDQKNIYVSAQNTDALVVFDRNTSTGDLTFNEVHVDNPGSTPKINSPKGIDISPDDKNVYITATSNDAISVFDRDASTGDLTFSDFVADGASSPSLMNQPLDSQSLT